MTYLGTARNDNGRVQMPDAFLAKQRTTMYETIDLGRDILLVANPLDRKRLERIAELADASIADHRSALEGLAK